MIATSQARCSLLDEEAVIWMKKQSERNSLDHLAIISTAERHITRHG